VELHAGVVAVGEAGLGEGHPVVEVAVELGDVLVVEAARVEAVLEYHALRRLLVHPTLRLLLGLLAYRGDLHLVLRAGSPACNQVIVSRQHFVFFPYLIIISSNV
jgi:hypothetical protein